LFTERTVVEQHHSKSGANATFAWNWVSMNWLKTFKFHNVRKTANNKKTSLFSKEVFFYFHFTNVNLNKINHLASVDVKHAQDTSCHALTFAAKVLNESIHFLAQLDPPAAKLLLMFLWGFFQRRQNIIREKGLKYDVMLINQRLSAVLVQASELSSMSAFRLAQSPHSTIQLKIIFGIRLQTLLI